MKRSLMRRRNARQAMWTALLLAAMSVALWALLSLLTETSFAGRSNYNTYTLQALAWREGRVSLGQDYPWLELAVYEGDWYVSFPPVPTVPVYLLTFLFGAQVPDNLLVKLYALIGMLALYFTLRPIQGNGRSAFIALMSGFCGSAMALATQGAVWYQAQVLAFCLISCAIYLAARRRITLSLFLYALSVGCRPFHVAYGPLLMLLWWRGQRERSLRSAAQGLWKGIVLGLMVAASYAAYNSVRFGNPFEFGTSYLPEFMRSEHGEFSLAHVAKNIRNFVLGGPFEKKAGVWSLKKFGFSLFLANPVLLCLLARVLLDAVQRRLNPVKVLCAALFFAQMFLLLLHRTFGGLQFGARYAVDLVPYYAAYLCADERALRRWEIVLMLAGAAFALYGVSVVHI